MVGGSSKIGVFLPGNEPSNVTGAWCQVDDRLTVLPNPGRLVVVVVDNKLVLLDQSFHCPCIAPASYPRIPRWAASVEISGKNGSACD
jgi:hypothetical protein